MTSVPRERTALHRTGAAFYATRLDRVPRKAIAEAVTGSRR